MNNGFLKVASVIPEVRVADVDFNVKEIVRICDNIIEEGDTEIVVFPELCITGYSCQDLFQDKKLLDAAEYGLMDILVTSLKTKTIFIVGVPIEVDGAIYNCAVVLQHGQILGINVKTYLPNYKEFYEKRWFSSSENLPKIKEFRYAGQTMEISSEPTIYKTSDGVKFGVEICEDVWTPIPPSSFLTLAGADIIFNLSASDELTSKNAYLRSLLAQQSARTNSAYVYSSCGYGESTQDVVYCGNALIYENGSLLASNTRFLTERQIVSAQIDIDKLRAERMKNSSFAEAQRIYKDQIHNIGISYCSESIDPENWKLERNINPYPFLGNDAAYEEIFNIQVLGLMKRIQHIGCSKVVLGVSGGTDSTLSLIVCVEAMKRLNKIDPEKWDVKNVIGITMPCFGTTGRTFQNSLDLMETLGVDSRTISINTAVEQHFKDIGLDESDRSITYENCQARERTQVLMDVANMENGIVVGSGDLSEEILGWATYNADHMSMYNPNCSIPKTLVKSLINFYAREICENSYETESGRTATVIMLDILNTPVSPELLPPNEDGTIAQVTEDNVGPYDLHDFFLYNYIRFQYTPQKLFLMASKAFNDTFTQEVILKWLKVFFKRMFTQQFKRSCIPDGPKVGSVSLSPRGDWRMPSDASYNIWLQELDSIKIIHNN